MDAERARLGAVPPGALWVLPNGKTLDLAVCVVAEIDGGKVTEVRECFDSATATDLAAALV
jgi:hypothetical protein